MAEEMKGNGAVEEKNVGMNANHYVADSASEDGGEKVVDTNKLQRQLKNRHIAMIRSAFISPRSRRSCG